MIVAGIHVRVSRNQGKCRIRRSQFKIFLSSGTAQTNGGGSLVIATYSFASYKVIRMEFQYFQLRTRLEAVLEAMSDYAWSLRNGAPDSLHSRILIRSHSMLSSSLVEQLQHRSKYISWQEYRKQAVLSEQIILFKGTRNAP